MKSGSVSKVVLLSFCLGMAACSTMNRSGMVSLENTDDGLPEYELTPMGVGTVTGAALGAGLGAVIGSATGDAGTGLLVGSVAGAAAGGIIGNELDREDRQIAGLEDELRSTRKERRIQDRRLETLQDEQQDALRLYDAPSLYQKDAAGAGSQRGRLRNKLPGGSRLPEAKRKYQRGQIREVSEKNSIFEEEAAELNNASDSRRIFPGNFPVRDPRPEAKPFEVKNWQANTHKKRRLAYNKGAISKYNGNYGGNTYTTRSARMSPALKEHAVAKNIKRWEEEQQRAGNLPESPAPVSWSNSKNLERKKPAQVVRKINSLPSAKKSVEPKKIAEKASKTKKNTVPGVKRESETFLNNLAKGQPLVKAKREGKVARVSKVKPKKASISSVAEEIIVPTKHPENLVLTSRSNLTNNPRCMDAKDEVVRASDAGSDADKLYYLGRALKLCPESSAYHLEAGKVYAKIGRKDEAVLEFRQAIDLNPDNLIARRELSKLDDEE